MITILVTRMLNTIIATDGGKGPVLQKGDTRTFVNGIVIRGLVFGYHVQVQDRSRSGGLLRTCCVYALV